MRSRNIKPGFFKNEYLAECDPLARILFTGLWCMADKDGFLEYRPKRIKIEILPYDSCNVEKLLEQLSNGGFISIWCTKQQESDAIPTYIEVSNFKKHQNPHKNEKQSEISNIINNQEISGTFEKLHDKHSTNPADSLNLIPDIIIPDSNTPPKPPKGEYTEGFEKFWKQYPKKIGKDAAFKKWKQVGKEGKATAGELIQAIIIQVQANHFCGANGDGEFIPNPATWLHQGRWKDEIKTKNTPANTCPPILDQATRYQDDPI